MKMSYGRKACRFLGQKKGGHLGVIAQELESVFPELVTDVTSDLEGDSGSVEEIESVMTKAVNYNGLIVAHIAAVQEQQARIEELEQQVQQ